MSDNACPLCKWPAKSEFSLAKHLKEYCPEVKRSQKTSDRSPSPPAKQQKKSDSSTLDPFSYRKRKSVSTAAEAVSTRKQPLRNVVILMCEDCWTRHSGKGGTWKQYDKDINSPKIVACNACAERNMHLWKLQNVEDLLDGNESE